MEKEKDKQEEQQILSSVLLGVGDKRGPPSSAGSSPAKEQPFKRTQFQSTEYMIVDEGNAITGQINSSGPQEQSLANSRVGAEVSQPPVVTQAQLDGLKGDTGKRSKVDSYEYFKPIIPKSFIATQKNRTFQAENPLTKAQTVAYGTSRLMFYVSSTLKEGASVPLHDQTEFPSSQQLVPVAYESLQEPKFVTWEQVSGIAGSPTDTTPIDLKIKSVLTSLNPIYIGVLLAKKSIQQIAEVEPGFDVKQSPKKAIPAEIGGSFGQGATIETAEIQSFLRIADKLFLSSLKFMHQVSSLHGGAVISEALSLKRIWEEFLTFTIAKLDPKVLKFNNQSYMASTSWYYSRGYTQVGETSKLIVKPVSMVVNAFDHGIVTNYPDLLLPTFFAIEYKSEVRNRYLQQFVDAGISEEQRGSRRRVMQDRVIGLEPEARNLTRFNLLESYESAATRWSSRYTKTSRKKDIKDFFSKEQYEKVRTALATEVDKVHAQLKNPGFSVFMNYPEWPSAKVSMFPYVSSVVMGFVGIDMANSAPSLGESSIHPYMNGLQLNYSIVSKFVWKRRTITPILDRVQFTKNLKSRYYIDEVMKTSPLVSIGNYSWHSRSIGLILRKKNRITLKAALAQTSGVDYDVITYPYVQNSLYWFKIFDIQSMNVRRIVSMTLWSAYSARYQDASAFQQAVWLQPYRDTLQTRQQLVWDQGAAVTLDTWHDAYDTLAESFVRKAVRKKFKTLFGVMKRHLKIANYLKLQGLNTDAQQVFINSIDSSKTLAFAFWYCAVLGANPSYVTRDSSSKGMTGANTAASMYFQLMTRNIDPRATAQQIYQDLGGVLLGGFATRPITVGINGDEAVPRLLSDLISSETDDDKRLVADLTDFCKSYYPGVYTIVSNKDQDGKTLLEMIDQSGGRKGAALVVMLLIAMFMELLETGLLMLQQYNSGYFKNISDKSFGLACHVWFSWIANISSKMREDMSLVGLDGITSTDVRNKVQQMIGQVEKLATYIRKELIRPNRRDRVTAKVKKDASEYVLFHDLFARYPDYKIHNLPAEQLDKRDVMPARRGPRIEMSTQKIRTATSRDASKVLGDMARLARLDYRSNMGRSSKTGRKQGAKMTEQQMRDLAASKGPGAIERILAKIDPERSPYQVQNDGLSVNISDDSLYDQVLKEVLPQQAFVWIDSIPYQDFYFSWTPNDIFTPKAYLHMIADFMQHFKVSDYLYIHDHDEQIGPDYFKHTDFYPTAYSVRSIFFDSKSLATAFGNTFKVRDYQIDDNLQDVEHYWETLARGFVNPKERPPDYYLDFLPVGGSLLRRKIDTKPRYIMNPDSILENTLFLIRDITEQIQTADYITSQAISDTQDDPTKMHYAFGMPILIALRGYVSSLTERMAKYWIAAGLIVALRIHPMKLKRYVSTLLQYVFHESYYPEIGSWEYVIATAYFVHLMRMIRFFPRQEGDWAEYDHSLAMIQNTASVMAWHVGSDYHLAGHWLTGSFQIYIAEPTLFSSELKGKFYHMQSIDVGSAMWRKPWMFYLFYESSEMIRDETDTSYTEKKYLGTYVPSLFLHHYWILSSVQSKLTVPFSLKTLVELPVKLTFLPDFGLRLELRSAWLSHFRYFLEHSSKDQFDQPFNERNQTYRNLATIFRKSLIHHLRWMIRESDRDKEFYPHFLAVQAMAPLAVLKPSHIVVIPHQSFEHKSETFIYAFRATKRINQRQFAEDWRNWYTQATLMHHKVPYEAVAFTLCYYAMILHEYPPDQYRDNEWYTAVDKLEYIDPAVRRFWQDPYEIEGKRTLSSRLQLDEENFFDPKITNKQSFLQHSLGIERSTAMSVFWKTNEEITFRAVPLPFYEIQVEREEEDDKALIGVSRDKYGKPDKSFFKDLILKREITSQIDVLKEWTQSLRTYSEWEDWLGDKLRFFTFQQQQKMYDWQKSVQQHHPQHIRTSYRPSGQEIHRWSRNPKKFQRIDGIGMNIDDFEDRVGDARDVWGTFLKIFGKVKIEFYGVQIDDGVRLPGEFVVFHLRADVPFREFAFCLKKTEATTSILQFQRRLLDQEKIDRLWAKVQQAAYEQSEVSAELLRVKGIRRFKIPTLVAQAGKVGSAQITRAIRE